MAELSRTPEDVREIVRERYTAAAKAAATGSDAEHGRTVRRRRRHVRRLGFACGRRKCRRAPLIIARADGDCGISKVGDGPVARMQHDRAARQPGGALRGAP